VYGLQLRAGVPTRLACGGIEEASWQVSRSGLPADLQIRDAGKCAD